MNMNMKYVRMIVGITACIISALSSQIHAAEMSFARGAKDQQDIITIQGIYPILEVSSHKLIDDFESTRQQIKKSIEAEYSAMRTGGSLLEPLVDDAIGLFDKALTVIP